jgi:hypothetical protein
LGVYFTTLFEILHLFSFVCFLIFRFVFPWLLLSFCAGGNNLSDNKPDFTFSTEHLILKSRVGTPVTPRNLNRTLDALIIKAGVPRITPHVSRHINATVNKDIGTPEKDVQQILGHANSEITRKIYQHGTSETQKRALTTIDGMLHTREENCGQKLQSKQDFVLTAEQFAALSPLLKAFNAQQKKWNEHGPFNSKQSPGNRYVTPVLQAIRTITNTQLFGAVAVKNCGHINRGRKMRELYQQLARLFS